MSQASVEELRRGESLYSWANSVERVAVCLCNNPLPKLSVAMVGSILCIKIELDPPSIDRLAARNILINEVTSEQLDLKLFLMIGVGKPEELLRARTTTMQEDN
jgi:hypothetical protein